MESTIDLLKFCLVTMIATISFQLVYTYDLFIYATDYIMLIVTKTMKDKQYLKNNLRKGACSCYLLS